MTLPFPTEVSAAEADNLTDIDALVNEFSIPRAEAEFALLRAHEALATMRNAYNAFENIEPQHRRVLIKTLVFAGMQKFIKQTPVPAHITLLACGQVYSEDQSNG